MFGLHPRDLIALFHSGAYRGDRARFFLKMPGERTGTNGHNIAREIVPSGFSQQGESGSGRGQRGDGTFVLRDT